ncbi:MAG: SDR family oxidoreductase [Fimbriimonas sp.]
MKILVTGGAGFIGSNLVGELLRMGHEVTAYDSLESGYAENLQALPDAEFIQADIRDADRLNEAIRPMDIVIHMAASVGNKKSIDHPVLDAEINVIGTINVLEAARKGNVKKVVFSSSAGTFGELKTIPIAIDHPTYPDSPYGCSKLYAEKVCGAYTHLYGLETVALRYFNVYGPHQRFDAYGNVIPIFVFKMLKGEPITIFGDGEQTRDFVNVADVVQANIKSALAEGVTGAYNIGSGSRITINKLVDMLGEASGMKPEVVYGEPRPGDVRHSLADISESTKAFGFEPSVDMTEGLKAYWEWAKDDKVGR